MTDASDTPQAGAPVVIKKYANRRLYNTATSRYVTLDTLCQMVKDGVDFTVSDARTGQDITRSVLTQIIVEEEGKGENLLPTSFLRSLIAMYGNNMQWLVPQYLDYMMRTFAQNQEEVQRQFSRAFGSFFALSNPLEMGKQNMAMLEQAMRMMNPFAASVAARPSRGSSAGAPPPRSQPAPASAPPPDADEPPYRAPTNREEAEAMLRLLESELDQLRRQLPELGRPGGDQGGRSGGEG